MKEAAARSLEYWASIKGAETALIEGETCLSWADWNSMSDLLAETLDRRGIGANDVVGVRTRTRMEWAVIAAAIAKIGARMLSIDRGVSPLAVRDVMLDSGACALIVDDRRPQEVGAALTGVSLRLRASIDTPAPGFMPFADLIPPIARPRFAPGFPSLLFYSAVENGRLRGMCIPRRIAVAASASPPPSLDDGASLVAICLTSALGYRQVQTALAAGRRMVFLRRFTPQAALDLVARHAVTEWTLSTSSSLRLAELAADSIAAFDLSSLKQVSAITGPIDQKAKARLVQVLGPVLFETYSAVMTGPLTALPPEARSVKPGSFGRPRPGVQIEIRDSAGRPVPANHHGDIWARTPMAMDSHPGVGESGPHRRDQHGFFRIGDIGRLDEDGYLYVAGRSADSAPRHPDAEARVFVRRLRQQS